MITVLRRSRRIDGTGELPAIDLELGIFHIPIRIRRSLFIAGFLACAALWALVSMFTRDYSSFFPSKLKLEVFYDRDGIRETVEDFRVAQPALQVATDWEGKRALYYQELDRETASPSGSGHFFGNERFVHSRGEVTFVVKKVSGFQSYHIEDAHGEVLHELALPGQPKQQLLTAFEKLETASDYLHPTFRQLVIEREFIIKPRFKQYVGAEKLVSTLAFKTAVVGVTKIRVFPLPEFSRTLYLADLPGSGLVPIGYAVYTCREESGMYNDEQ